MISHASHLPCKWGFIHALLPRRTGNPKVVGSNRTWATEFFRVSSWSFSVSVITIAVVIISHPFYWLCSYLLWMIPITTFTNSIPGISILCFYADIGLNQREKVSFLTPLSQGEFMQSCRSKVFKTFSMTGNVSHNCLYMCFGWSLSALSKKQSIYTTPSFWSTSLKTWHILFNFNIGVILFWEVSQKLCLNQWNDKISVIYQS